jgi:3-hydroxymyristoyl/3-hydroxydecanoyl-(acyl carrier protein) dehydratase
MRSSRHATVFDALAEAPLVERTAAGFRCESRVPVDAAAEVMAGHYPGHAILPGVLVVDCVCQLLAYVTDGALRVTAVERLRFLNVLLPGDELLVVLTVTEDRDSGRIRGQVRGRRRDGSPANEARLLLEPTNVEVESDA